MKVYIKKLNKWFDCVLEKENTHTCWVYVPEFKKKKRYIKVYKDRLTV